MKDEAQNDDREVVEGYPYPPILQDPEKPPQFSETEIVQIDVWKQQATGKFSIITTLGPLDVTSDLELLDVAAANSKEGDGSGVYKICGRDREHKVRAWRYNVCVGDFAPKKVSPSAPQLRAAPPAASSPAGSPSEAAMAFFGAIGGLITALTPLVLGFLDATKARSQAEKAAIDAANERMMTTVVELAKARNTDMEKLLKGALEAARGGGGGGGGDAADLLDTQKAMYEEFIEKMTELGGAHDPLTKIIEAAAAGWFQGQANPAPAASSNVPPAAA